MSLIRNELSLVKSKLEEIDQRINDQLKEIELKSQRYTEADILIQEMLKTNDNIITINVGGKIFQSKLSTIVSFKDSLFYILFSNNLAREKQVPTYLFFDRNFTYFPLIMDYIRTKFLNIKNLSKLQKEDLNTELEYYGLKDSNKSKNIKLIDLFWSDELSKKDACTIENDDPKLLYIHSFTCYTHFVTNIEFSEENVQVEFEVDVQQNDNNHMYIGVVNEHYSFSSSCMCCNVSNAFYIKCDGSIHMSGIISSFNSYAWFSNKVTIGFRLYSSNKKLIIYKENEEELGPFDIIGNRFRFVAGHCNSGKGKIIINECKEIHDY